MKQTGKVKNQGKIKAVVIKANGKKIDYGTISGPWHEVLISKLKRRFKQLWQR